MLALLFTFGLAFLGLPPGTAKGSLRIRMQHTVGQKPLVLDSVQYANALGQPYTVTRFRYYIGRIGLQRTEGGIAGNTEYHLIDESEPAGKSFIMNGVPAGQYSLVTFIIGVDSAHNCSGAQTGALDPVNGMFWSWNTGYIFLKLEGTSPASTMPGNMFEYHIGGYKEPAKCIRLVTLMLPHPVTVTPGGMPEVTIRADVASILDGPVTIDFSRLPSVTAVQNATMMADNYADMFTIGRVVQ